jgi:hypothetical protein
MADRWGISRETTSNDNTVQSVASSLNGSVTSVALGNGGASVGVSFSESRARSVDDSAGASCTGYATAARSVVSRAALCADAIGGGGTMSHKGNTVVDAWAFRAGGAVKVGGVSASSCSTRTSVSIGGFSTRASSLEDSGGSASSAGNTTTGGFVVTGVTSCASLIGGRSTSSRGTVFNGGTINTSGGTLVLRARAPVADVVVGGFGTSARSSEDRGGSASSAGNTTTSRFVETGVTLCANLIGRRCTMSHASNTVFNSSTINTSGGALVLGIRATRSAAAHVGVGGFSTRARSSSSSGGNASDARSATSSVLVEIYVTCSADHISRRCTVYGGTISERWACNTSVCGEILSISTSGASFASVGIFETSTRASHINDLRSNTRIARCASSGRVDEVVQFALCTTLIGGRSTMSLASNTVGDSSTIDTTTGSRELGISTSACSRLNVDSTKHSAGMNLANVPQISTPSLGSQHILSDHQGQGGIVCGAGRNGSRCGGYSRR